MLDTIREVVMHPVFLAICLYISCCAMLLIFTTVPYPYNYAMMMLPHTWVFLLVAKEQLRKKRHTFAHGYAKPTFLSQERRDTALKSYIEEQNVENALREAKKTKPLP